MSKKSDDYALLPEKNHANKNIVMPTSTNVISLMLLVLSVAVVVGGLLDRLPTYVTDDRPLITLPLAAAWRCRRRRRWGL